MADFTPASRGVGAAGLTTGIIGTALGVMNGGLGNILGGAVNPQPAVAHMAAQYNGGCCSEDRPVNRYEANQQAEIEKLRTENSLLKADTYTDQKILATYQYIDEQLKDIRGQLCAQAVHNQRTEDSFALASRDLMAVKAELAGQIALEAERRCCADNSIVNYVNATFYPVNVADVTVGTTSTAQARYNPIPKCGCCGGNG